MIHVTHTLAGLMGYVLASMTLGVLGYANVYQNSSLISNEFLRRLKNTLAFTMSINRQYSALFARSGTKPGVTINLRKPPNFSGRRGQRANPEGISDQVVPLTINTQYGQDVAISSQEEALNLQDYANQVTQPAVDKIGNMVDSDGLALYVDVPYFVGTPGTMPTDNYTFINAGTILSDNAVPRTKDRFAVVNPTMEGKLLNTQATQFNAQVDIAEQNRTGAMGRAFGLNFAMDQNVTAHTVGALGGTPLVNVAGGVAEGATSVVLDGASNSITSWVRRGDIVTFASSNAVNPQSKINLGYKRTFAIAQDASSDGSGNVTIYLTEAIRATGPYQNVTARPADNDAVQTFGAVSTYAAKVSAQCLAYHKDFITFATVDLYIPRGVEMASRAQSTDLNLSCRHVRYYDGREDQLVDRYDCLGGWKVLRSEMAVRICG